ncbi:MAG: tetratricopeptide repeat protein [Streptosporangiaceae bacterium]|jgi:tetratricopeptide (TPR) repeat protein
MDSRVLAGGPSIPPRERVMSGTVPPLADGFISRPETGPGLQSALGPGGLAVLVPHRDGVGGPPDWLGSCGKSQLAISYARSAWQSGTVDLLIWIVATSRASVLSGYVEAAVSMMGIDPADEAESVASRFVAWLGETTRQWLVVFDDLADAADLAGLWPEGPAGRVLITTDSAASTGGHGAQVVPVGVFSTREALSYVMGRLTSDPDQRFGAIDMVDELGCEPIALAHASALIADSTLSCRDFRDYFSRRREELVAAAGEKLPSAAVTWTFSFEQAGRRVPGGAAHSILALATMLDGRAIPAAVFNTTAALAFLGGDGRPPATRDRAQGAVLQLERAALLSVDLAGTAPTVRMNPAVQAAVRTVMPPGLPDRAARAAADALLEIWPEDEPRAWTTAALRSCAAALRQAAGDVLWAGGCHPVLLRAGQSLENARLTGPAVRHWRDLAVTGDRIHGPGHPDTLIAGEHMADAYLTAGRTKEALPWFEWVLAARMRAPGPDHPRTIAARCNLGHALVVAGQLAEAITILSAAVEDYERVRGPDHLDTVSAREELAAAYQAAGQSAEAIAIYRRALADRERVLGSRHPDVLTARYRLAGACLADGELKDAVSLYKKTLADRQRVLGPDHLDTIAARGGLGAANHTAGKMGTALNLYEQTSADYERVLGAAHPSTLAYRANLARAYYTVGRVGDAIPLLRDTLSLCERVLPSGDPLTQAVRESLTNIAG